MGHGWKSALLLSAVAFVSASSFAGSCEQSGESLECLAPEIEELQTNRAYHEHLVRNSDLYVSFEGEGGDALGNRLKSYQLYLALTEAFAAVLSPDDMQRAKLLNRVYDQQIEITEARIKGRGNLADNLERRVIQ